MATHKDGHLPRAFSATLESLDSTDLAHCLEGTRQDVLQQVYCWINGDNKRKRKRSGDTNAKESPCIFLINGSAGTGKYLHLIVGQDRR
jgi:hypothetical protein